MHSSGPTLHLYFVFISDCDWNLNFKVLKSNIHIKFFFNFISGETGVNFQ